MVLENKGFANTETQAVFPSLVQKWLIEPQLDSGQTRSVQFHVGEVYCGGGAMVTKGGRERRGGEGLNCDITAK